jgi:hypothetical protein
MATKRISKRTGGDDDPLTRQIGVRLTEADYSRLEGLAGNLSVSAIVRAALLVGLDLIEEQPGILLGQKRKGSALPWIGGPKGRRPPGGPRRPL